MNQFSSVANLRLAGMGRRGPPKPMPSNEQRFFCPMKGQIKNWTYEMQNGTAPAWRKLAKTIFHVYVAKGRESSSCAFLQSKTFNLAQLGSAGLLSKVPVFHHVCSTYIHRRKTQDVIQEWSLKNAVCLYSHI